MNSPDVMTIVKVYDRNFRLDVYAYRHITEAEARFCLKRYLQTRRLKHFPVGGHGKLLATFGQDEV